MSKPYKLSVVAPDRTVYEDTVQSAIVPAEFGYMGVLADHAPTIVALKPGATGNPESIIAWARERIASYKVPKSVDFIPALPRNPSGKILRRELRAPYWQGRQRQVN